MADDVIIRIRTAFEKGGIAAAEAELKKIEGAARGAAAQTSKVEGSFSSLASSVARSDLGRTIAGYFAIRSVVDFTQAIVQAELQFQKTTRSLEFATGSAKAAAEGYQFVRTEARRLGVEVASVAEQFARFAAGAKGSTVSAQDIKTVFIGVITASRALGQSTTDTERAFRALTQIIGKGKVTAEEFRGQIGDAIPGAAALGAKALGVTTAEFSRLLDAGELTIDFLPKFGQVMIDTFGGTAEKAAGDLQSSISRISTAFNDLKLAVADTQAFNAGIRALGSLAGAIDTVTQAIKDSNSGGSPFPGRNVEGIAVRKAAFDKLIADIKQREADAALAGGTAGQEQAPVFSQNQTKALDDASKALKEQARAANAQREALNLSNAEAVRSVTIQKEIAKAIADGAPVTRGLIDDSIAAADAESNLTRAQEAKAESLRTGKKAESEAASEARSRASAAREFSESLTKQITVSDAQAEALNRGGQAGARYQVVQTQISQAIAAGVPVTGALREEIDRLAESQTRLAGVQFAEGLKAQTAEVDLQRAALATGGAEGARFTVVQTEINKAIAAGAEVTPALRAEIEKYAGTLALLSSEEFSKSITEQTEAISAQATALQIGSETSVQYAALQKEIVEQLERGIPITDEQRQALVSLGQEEERYAIIQGKIAEALANRIDLSAELIQQIRDQADAQVNLNASREEDNLNERAAENLTREFERQSNAITETLTDAIFRGFENGKGFAENFKDTVVNLFKTLVLRPVIEAIVKPVAQAASNIVGSLVQGVVGSVFGGAGGGGSGIFGSLLSTGASAGIGALASNIGGATSTIAGFTGQVIPQLASTAGSLGSAASSLTSTAGSLTSIPGLLQSVVSGLATPKLAAFASIAAQEAVGAIGGQAAGSTAAGIAGNAFGNLGAGAIGILLAKAVGLGGGTIADSILGTVGSLAGGAIGGAIAAATTGAAAAAATGAAIGAAGGSAAAAAAGGSAAAAGATAGSVVPIIGTIIGAILGVALGTTIKPSLPRGFQSVDFSSGKGKFRKGGKGGFDAGDLDPAINQLVGSIQEVDKVLDLDLITKKIKFFIGFKAGKGFRANIGGEDRDFDSLGKAQGSIFKEELLGALPDKERTKFQNTVLKRAFAPENDLFVEQLKSIKKDLEVRDRLKQFTKIVEFDPRLEKTKELTKELRDLEKAFGKLRGEARALGLDTARAEKAFKKTKQSKLDEITGIQVQGEAEKITAQQQAYQLAGESMPVDLQVAGVEAQFKVLGIQFRELGLDTTILTELLAEALQNLNDTRTQASLTAQASAFQAAGQTLPMYLQSALVELQFQQLAQQFRDLGLDTQILTDLLAAALANLEDVRAAARIQAQSQAFQLAGRQVPIELQRAGVQLQFKELGQQFADLGLDASILTELLAEALANLDKAREVAKVQVQAQAYQLAGREVPIELQQAGIVQQFAELGDAFAELGLDSSLLAQLLAEALANLAENLQAAKYQAQLSALGQAFQLAGREAPIELQRALIEFQFAELGRQFEELGLDASGLAELLAEALGNLEEAQVQARQSALERAYQLAGEEVPKELQIAGIMAEFAALGEQFLELGLDTGILGPLLQKAIDKINKAGEDLRTGGFIGFVDEFGRISEYLGEAANDSQFFGSSGSPYGLPDITPPGGPAQADIPTDMWPHAPPDMGTHADVPSDLWPHAAGRTIAGDERLGDVIINFHGHAVFDDITQAKFTREVGMKLRSRGKRFG